MPSQANSDIPASSASVVMLSAPDTQDNPQDDVFHTPPEEASLHSSDDDVPLCAVNQADAGSQVFVDSVDSSEFLNCRKDSDLGFSEEEGELKDEIDAGFVPENSRGVVSEDFGVSDLGESPTKKLKLGFGEQVNDDDDSCREIPMVPEENVETQVARNAGDVNLNERNNSSCEDPLLLLRMLPDSIRCLWEKETASGLESQRVEEKKKFSVFDVLKVLAETAKEEEEEDDDDGLTVLETAKRSGVIFPRPSWWPEDMKYELFNFDDKE